MDNTPLEDRRFSDEEMREILKKAVESSSGSTSLTRQDGHSLEELKAIGREVGIDPARLEEAARLVTVRGAGQRRHLLGGPTLLYLDRAVPGEIPPEKFPDALAVIRRELGSQGEAAEIHGSLEWRQGGERGEQHLAIRSKNGETQITAGANLRQTAVVAFLPASIIGTMITIIGTVASAEAGNPLGIMAAATTLPIIWTVGRQIMKAVSRGQAERLERAAAALGRLAGESRDEA